MCLFISYMLYAILDCLFVIGYSYPVSESKAHMFYIKYKVHIILSYSYSNFREWTLSSQEIVSSHGRICSLLSWRLHLENIRFPHHYLLSQYLHKLPRHCTGSRIGTEKYREIKIQQHRISTEYQKCFHHV